MRGLSSTANVVVDGLAHLGPLSYVIPEGMNVRPGDAVEVPVGKRAVAGLVIGPGDAGKATREILQRYGERTTPTDIATAHLVATAQASQMQQLAARMAPKSGKGSAPSLIGPEFLTVPLPDFTDQHHTDADQWLLLLHTPSVRPEELAAAEAARLVGDGQVLILCPTTAMVERVLSKTTGGTVRLDAKAGRGDWAAFREGAAPVGVGTRAAAWYAPERLSAIIVVDEGNPGHREQRAPRHHARDVAIARAKAAGVPLVLLSMNPTPSAMGSGVQVYEVSPKTGPAWPTLRVHDESLDAVRSPDLPWELTAELEEFAARSTMPPVVVVSGSSTRRCVGCFAEVPKTKKGFERCLECGEVSTKVLGFDKERIEDLFEGQVKAVLPAELETLTDVGFVVLTDMQSLLSRPDLNPYHRAVDLILNAAAAAGNRGVVVAVTRDGTHPVLRLLFERKDQLGIAQRSFNTAKRLGLPPFGKLVTLQLQQKELPDMSGWPGHVHGPAKVKGGWEFVIRCQPGDIPAVTREVWKLRKRKVKMRYHIE